jgi:gamma-glutamyltranspeptidase / glutathione hydrolase
MRIILLFLSLFVLQLHALEPIIRSNAKIHPTYASNGMVVSQDTLATQAALEILKEGGTAADAAVTLGYVLAVTQPKAGNLGGGGFALYFHKESNKTYAIDFRETAPQAAHKNLFLDNKGEVDQNKARFSLLSSGIPGTIAGLEHLRKEFGTQKFQHLVSPAIRYAKEGFPVSPGLAYDLKQAQDIFLNDAYLAKIFTREQQILTKNDLLIQTDLSKTLERLAKNGPNDFYTGSLAKEFVSYFHKNNGIISQQDLKNYQVKVRQPTKGQYRDVEIFSMPPPSSGGIHLIQILNILEQWDLRKSGHNSASTIHLMAEAMKLAYADRSLYLGDPDYIKVPMKGLTSKEYGKVLSQKIKLTKATPASEIHPGSPTPYESPDTTHYSIADKYGNVLSLTYTINFSFGNRKMIPGLGFFLNNEMDDFSAKTGVANAYGLVGSQANSISAGKRPLSSMTPTIVFKKGKPWLVSGSPGGSRIITATLQIILNTVDHQMNIAEAVMAPRIHHQWLPDILNIEAGISPDTIKLLQLLGHSTSQNGTSGCTETILIEDKLKYGFADPRRIDGKAAGH